MLGAAGMEKVKAVEERNGSLQLKSFLQNPQEPTGGQRDKETFI